MVERKVRHRRAGLGGGLVARTDHGSQHTSLRYTDRLDEYGIAPSVGSRGDAYDNAVANRTSLHRGNGVSFD